MRKTLATSRENSDRTSDTTRDRVLPIIILLVAVPAVAVGAVLLIRYLSATGAVGIAAPGLSAENAQRLLQFFSESEIETEVELIDANGSQDSGGGAVAENADVLIHILAHASWTDHPANMTARILQTPEAPVASSVLRAVSAPDGVRAYPIALDHVELAYRRDLFSEELLTSDGRLRDLASLEDGLRRLTGGRLFPMIVAGADNEALLDLVSVLTLSTGGLDRYRRLLDAASSEPTEVVTQDLGDGWTLGSVLNLLRRWTDEGLLHPNWDEFSEMDVREMVQRQLAGAVVMRLSTHRSWPVQILNRIRTSPFPFQNADGAGTAIIAPIVAASYTGRTRRQEKAEPILQALVDRKFQETVVRFWRLAPVHTTAETLDRESRDLRFWAAASRELLPSLADAMPAEDRQALASFIREGF